MPDVQVPDESVDKDLHETLGKSISFDQPLEAEDNMVIWAYIIKVISLLTN